MLLAFVGVVAPAGSALAASAGGLTLTVSYGGQDYDGTTVVEPGTTYTASLQYDATVVESGGTVTLTVPDGISIDPSTLDASGNEVIASITGEGNELTVTFEDPVPPVAQGVFSLEFVFDEPTEGSEIRPVTWALDGESTTADVIVREAGDEFMPEFPADEGKSVDGVNLSQYVTVDGEGNVTVDEDIIGVAIPYTIEIDSTDARTVTITDEIDAFLGYDQGSFSATLVSWDENGLNRTEQTIELDPSFGANSFSIADLELPANSQLTLNYTASVSEADGLEQALGELAADVVGGDNYDGGSFEISLVNTATIDGTQDSADVSVGGDVPAMPRPDAGAAFGKSSDTSGNIEIEVDEDGDFLGPVDVTYTLSADLREFAEFVDTTFALDQNVVIVDRLPAQADWAGDDFLSVDSDDLDLVLLTEFDADTFADSNVGSYHVTDDGELWINVGQDVTQNYTFTAAAQITEITGGTQDGNAFRYDGITNTAEFGYGIGQSRTDSTDHRPWTPAPNPATAFGKSSENEGDIALALDEAGDAFDEAGNLVEPIDVTYTLSADLTQFTDFADEFFALEQNVIIADELPVQMTWADGDFVTVDGGDLTLALVQDLDWDAFAGTDPGSYQVVDNELWINVGQNVEAAYEFTAAAQITSVEGLTRSDSQQGDWPQYTEAVFTGLSNNAQFYYRDGTGPQRDSVSHRLTLPMDPRQGIDDPEQFNKTVSDEPHTARPGESLEVPYSFAVAAGAVPDLAESQIVDYVDQDVFDLSDLDAIRESITGTYGGGPVSGDSFELALDNDGNLVITTSEALGAPLEEALEFTLSLPTHPIEGKQTITIVNNASLTGNTDEEWVWVSEASGSATSYGAELEVAKSIYTGDDNWTQNFRVEVDQEGELTQDEFIYRVELIPHPGYQNVAIIPLEDVLPTNLEFEGFVANDDLDTGNVSDGDTVDMGGNIQATWNAEEGVLHIEQRDGTTIGQGEPILVNFKVTMTEFTQDVPVTNYVGPSSATITPSNAFPLLVQKLDDSDETVTITDRDARFTITGPDGGDIVTEEAYVVGGQLMRADADGEDVGIVVEEPGRYEVTETIPPAGYDLSDTTVGITVDEEGNSEAVRFFNSPTPPQVSVGDFVWVDTNRDGIQDDGEPGIEGVTLVLTGPDGEPVTDVYGEPVEPTVTDGQGLYTFDRLPVLEEGQSYTVTIDQEASEDALAPYNPTLEEEGDDRGEDSSTWTASSTGLTEHGDRDPTLDFGFVLPMVSVGDFVWVDTNRDGIQDEGEPGIEGVTLVLTGPDGEPVTDVYGNVVEPTVTDEDGHYTFEGLPVLEEAQSYTVTIDRDASEEALAPYIPTLEEEGDDPAEDSSSWSTESILPLGTDGDRDPTLDFGFVQPRVSVGDYVWEDTNRDGIQDDGEPGIPGVTLIIEGPDGEPVTDVFGDPVGPVVTDEQGHYTFEDLPALGPDESYTVTIDRDASEEALAPYIPTLEGQGDDPEVDSSTWTAESTGLTEDGDRDPTLDFGFVQPMVSVGDYVWVDTNRDGIQDDGEPGIEGVTLVLTGPDGEPVTDVYGDLVEPTVTDENGHYTFEGLPVLEDGQSYTVTIDREASAEALAPYIPTLEGAGDDPAQDSSTWSTESVRPLDTDGDRDPTLDFGFVQPMVSVGDFVWVDTNGDGIQDEGEPGIPDVTLVLTGPDGEPVTDVYGNVVEPTVTDENGHYTFEGLPVLEDGQSYTVTIDREASAEALAPYIPTLEGAGDDRGVDSSTWSATSTGLTEDGERDPTLDFGFVLAPVDPTPGDPEDPTPGDLEDPTPGDPEDPQVPGDELPASGIQVGTLVAIAAMVLIMGFAARAISRRRSTVRG